MAIDPKLPRPLAQSAQESPLLCCAFDPSGRFVLSGGRHRSLSCLDVAAGTSTPLEGHDSWVGCLVRAIDGLVVSADFAGRLIAWDCAGDRPQIKWNVVAHATGIQALAVSADGQRLATGDREGIVRVWQISDQQRLHEITGIGHPVTALAFHPDGRQLLTADRQPKSPRLKLWELETRREVHQVEVPQLSAYRRVEDIEWGAIRAVAISGDGNLIVACGSDGYAGPACALLFPAGAKEPARKLSSALKGYFYSAQFHPQGFLLTAGGDLGKGEFTAWNPQTGEALSTVSTPGPCTGLDVHPDGRRLVASQMSGKGSYPSGGLLALYEWPDAPEVTPSPDSES